jgi:hypothetical protein
LNVFKKYKYVGRYTAEDINRSLCLTLKGFCSFGIVKGMEEIFNKNGFVACISMNGSTNGITIELANGLNAFYDIEILKDIVPFTTNNKNMEI